MKILYYCQHVLGIGHFFRSLEICRAFAAHEVIMVTGGPSVDVSLPRHVREVRLPALQMDREFKDLRAADAHDGSVEQIRQARRARLFEVFATHAPDLCLIELYPFGRKAFRFELDPLLTKIRARQLPASRVVCSLRDILVEKADPLAYETRVLETLKAYFDALLIHADPKLVALDETFSRAADIAIPVVYTGFVTPKPEARVRQRLRRRLRIGDDDRLIVASAGGGKVGAALLQAAMAAHRQLDMGHSVHLHMFTGPFMDLPAIEGLEACAGENQVVRRFTAEFISYLAAADLSVSMAGYNTCMNILAARVPALVWPFSQNREQRMRSERLARLGAVEILMEQDLKASRLAAAMTRLLSRKTRPSVAIDLEGAANSVQWLESWMAGGGARPPTTEWGEFATSLKGPSGSL